MIQPKLYVIGDDHGFIKIGTSKDPLARLEQLQTGNPNRLSLIAVCDPPDGMWADWGMRQVEWMLHDYMRSMELGADGEWFKPGIFTTIAAESLANGWLSRGLLRAIAGVPKLQIPEKP